MKSLLIPVTMLLLLNTLLSGCAALVIGGAAVTGAIIATDRRTPGAFVEDETIELKAKQAVSKDEPLASARIKIISYNGIVLIVGEAPTEQMRDQATRIVEGVDKVRTVHNEMRIAPPNSAAQRNNDSYITAKVKTSLFGKDSIEGIDATRVKVVTSNETVYLMGLLTRQEADAVTETVRRVKGVQRVVKLFEYHN